MELGPREYWPLADKFVAERGDIPTIVFSPMGTAFTGHLQATRKAKKCFTASTQDLGWLATGVKMLRTIWDMKTTRLLHHQRRQDRRPAAGRDRNHAAPYPAGSLDRRVGQAGRRPPR